MFLIYKNVSDYFFVLCCLVDFFSYSLDILFPYFSMTSNAPFVPGCIYIIHVTKLKPTDNILFRPTCSERYWKYVKYPYSYVTRLNASSLNDPIWNWRCSSLLCRCSLGSSSNLPRQEGRKLLDDSWGGRLRDDPKERLRRRLEMLMSWTGCTWNRRKPP